MKRGHRERLRKRYIESYPGISDRELLELILYYCNRRKDTKPLAYAILTHFNNDLEAVFAATPEELMKIEGVGEASAGLLGVFSAVCTKNGLYRDAEEEKTYFGLPIIKAFAESYYDGVKEERLDLVFFDNGFNEIGSETLSAQSISAETAEAFFRMHPARVAALRNSLRGTEPDSADRETIREISKALKGCGSELFDYIIVCKNSSRSLANDFEYCALFDL
ncbi:MAG: hypothetical protein K6C14_05200 [Eubacterium sp.]|nr:hypothetical protein [Eubacterium sp.]